MFSAISKSLVSKSSTYSRLTAKDVRYRFLLMIESASGL